MDEQILMDPMVELKDNVLENALGEKYKLFIEFSEEIKEPRFFYAMELLQRRKIMAL